MIVKCENCQTRFKIPDDKVTEKGVKVRCTKCSHTFRVERGADGSALIVPAAPSAAPPVAGVPENPFAQFAPPPGGEMFSKNTRIAPLPSRPESPKPGMQAEVTKKGPTPTDVTKRAPIPTRDDLAAVFGMEPEAVTNPAMAFGKVSSSARTDPASVYGGGGLPGIPGFTPAPPPVSGGKPPPAPAPASIQIDAAIPPGPPPKGFVPAGFEPSANTIPSSGPTSGNHPQAGPRSSAPVSSGDSDPSALGPGSGRFSAAGGPDHSLFDIPPPPPEPTGASPELDGAGMGFGSTTAPGLDALAQPVRSPMMSPPPRPSGRPEDARGVEEYSEPGAARRYAGLITNLAVAAGLVLLLVTGGSVYLNE